MKDEPTSFCTSLPGKGMDVASLKTCGVCSSECALVWLSAVVRSTIPQKLDGARHALELNCMRKSSVTCCWWKESTCSTSAAQTLSRRGWWGCAIMLAQRGGERVHRGFEWAEMRAGRGRYNVWLIDVDNF